VSSAEETRLLALLASLSPDGVARQRREAVEALRERGWSLAQIAVELGVTKAAVGNWVNRQS
jgi:DNA-directed RNA polymerase specialized sigma24 family protein